MLHKGTWGGQDSGHPIRSIFEAVEPSGLNQVNALCVGSLRWHEPQTSTQETSPKNDNGSTWCVGVCIDTSVHTVQTGVNNRVKITTPQGRNPKGGEQRWKKATLSARRFGSYNETTSNVHPWRNRRAQTKCPDKSETKYSETTRLIRTSR